MKSYLIAFSGRPIATFLSSLLQMCKQDSVTIAGAVLCDGPGCYNLAIMVPDDTPESFVEHLTMALMPSQYSICNDPQLVEGKFIDHIHGGA